MKNKKGLSTVITSLIIILLVLVAIGIVWVVIRNVLSEGVEQVSLGKFMIDLKIKDVAVNLGNIDVKVKRNPGQGELTGIKFLVSDGVNVQEFEEATNIGELGESTFTLNYTGLVKEVSIAPILKSGSGKDSVGNEIDKKEFSNKEIIENLGGISWWRFEGNANDEVGDNDGTLYGNIDCNLEGKFGKACEFDGSSSLIKVPDSSSLQMGGNSFSLLVWMYLESGGASNEYFFYGKAGAGYYSGSIYIMPTTRRVYTYLSDGVNQAGTYTSTNAVPLDVWTHVVIVYNRNNDLTIVYLNDGEIDGQISISSVTGDINPTGNLTIGGSSSGAPRFKGKLDELMIFNKALSEEEIKALYELDLS